MHSARSIKMFLNQHIRKESKVILCLSGILFLLSISCLLINATTTHYIGNNYTPGLLFAFTPFALLLIGAGDYFQQQQQNNLLRLGLIIRGTGIIVLSMVVGSLIFTGIQYTPFPTIDNQLLAADTMLGFSSTAALNWTYTHPTLLTVLRSCYLLLPLLMLIAPITLMIQGKDKRFNIFACACLMSWLIGSTIYYFFPAVAPASMFDNSHFSAAQHATALKFNQIHNYLAVTTTAGGMVAFPSFHVVWACMGIYAFAKHHRLLFIPVSMFCLLVMASTVLLGWHYLVDVFGGIATAWLSIAISKQLLYPRSKTIKQKVIRWIKQKLSSGNR